MLSRFDSVDARLARLEDRLEAILGLSGRVGALEQDAAERRQRESNDERDRRSARRGTWGNAISAAVGSALGLVLGHVWQRHIGG